MKKVLSRILVVVVMVAAIVGLVFIGVSGVNSGNNVALNSGQACVCVGLFIFVIQNLVKKFRK